MLAEITAVHPVLKARDVATSIQFYIRLGFIKTFCDATDAPRYAAIRRGPVELHLQWADPGQWENSADCPAYRFLCPEVDAVDALHSEFIETAGLDAAASHGPLAVPANTAWGTREFHLRDPGGNVLQFYCPLPTNGIPSPKQNA